MASGKKYGLIIPPKKGNAATKKVEKPSIFNDSSDEEESEFSGKFWKERKKKSKQFESHESVVKALAEDPSIFEYDSVYDDMQEKKKKADPRLQKKDTKPKYIYQLKKMAEKRKLEQEIVYERKVQREMEKEDGDFEEKDTFVTSAYRKKLEERRKLEEELLKEDTIDAANDVRKQTDLSKFHRNLLNQMTTPKKDDSSSKTDKQQTRVSEQQRAEETTNQEHEHRNDDRTPRERRHSNPHSPADSKSSKSRQESVTSDKGRSPSVAEAKEMSVDNQSEQMEDVKPTVKLPTKEDLEEKRKVVAAKRTNTEAKESAKERYLARKRAKLSVPVIAQDD